MDDFLATLKRWANSTITVIVLTIIVAVAGQAYYSYGTVEEIQVTILDKERICDKQGQNCNYMVFTDKETFNNVDSIWHLKFRSSDIYGALQEGEKYQIVVQGFRIPFLSQYRNILTYDIIRDGRRGN